MILGTCLSTRNLTFFCQCANGWTGTDCEIRTDHCSNVSCLNGGICRPVLLAYRSECLSQSYSGQHCEIVAARIILFQTVSKSLAYIAIVALITVAIVIMTMDVLKYCFGIDAVKEEIQILRQQKKKKKIAKKHDRKVFCARNGWKNKEIFLFHLFWFVVRRSQMTCDFPILIDENHRSYWLSTSLLCTKRVCVLHLSVLTAIKSSERVLSDEMISTLFSNLFRLEHYGFCFSLVKTQNPPSIDSFWFFLSFKRTFWLHHCLRHGSILFGSNLSHYCSTALSTPR